MCWLGDTNKGETKMFKTCNKVVNFDGPFPAQNQWGDEYPYWTVCIADGESGEPIGKVYTCHSHQGALNLAKKMAADRRLELVEEALTA
jgi:hypothetical protein